MAWAAVWPARMCAWECSPMMTLLNVCKHSSGFTLVRVVSTWNWSRTAFPRVPLTFSTVTINVRHVHLDHPTTRALVTSLRITWPPEMDSTSSLMLRRSTGRRSCRLSNATRFSDIAAISNKSMMTVIGSKSNGFAVYFQTVNYTFDSLNLDIEAS